MGLVADPELHGYHCQCPNCDFGWDDGPPLMVQRDSTCSGEVISRPMRTSMDDYGTVTDEWPVTQHVLGQLQSAAVDVDAEPGEGSGFHVHVMPPTGAAARASLGAVLLWEPVLQRIAAGRFPDQRSMNRSVRSLLGYGNISERVYGAATSTIAAAESVRGFLRRDDWTGRTEIDYPALFAHHGSALTPLLRALGTAHSANDRHSNFNTRTDHGTVEYRFWNSTRSAWRMEMFCRLSVAMTDPAVTNSLMGLGGVGPNQHADENFMAMAEVILRQVMADTGYQRLAELLERQASYRSHRFQVGFPAAFVVA